jgi:hypothetical protein
MKSIDRVVINPVIFFLFAVAMVYFLYGVTRYFLSPDNTEVRDSSKAQMIWGVVGLFIMVAVFGILQVILNTFGITNVKIQSNGDYAVTIQDPAVASQISGFTMTGAPNGPQEAYNLNNGLGAWDANKNYPQLTSGTGTKGSYYTVTVAGTTQLDGVSSWNVGDIAYFDGTQWTKQANSTILASSNPLVYTAPINGDTTASPFKNSYQSDSLCWREAAVGSSTTEYQASQSATNIARADFLSATGESDQMADPRYPIVAEQQTLYDPSTKEFYAWLGVVAPIGNGLLSDCKILPTPSAASTRANPFTESYADTATDYEVVDSASDPDLTNAKGMAIQNALIQIAQEEGVVSTANVSYTILDGKYYPPDETSDNYDYWVVLDSPKQQ